MPVYPGAFSQFPSLYGRDTPGIPASGDGGVIIGATFTGVELRVVARSHDRDRQRDLCRAL
jgi:hypothetical protein